MSEGETLFADAYGMTARHRAEFAPFAVDMARRYHEDSRACAELDPVYHKLWEDGAQVYLPRAEVWLRDAAPGDHRPPGPAGLAGRPRNMGRYSLWSPG